MGSSLQLCLEWFFTLPEFCLVGPDTEGGFLSKCRWSPPAFTLGFLWFSWWASMSCWAGWQYWTDRTWVHPRSPGSRSLYQVEEEGGTHFISGSRTVWGRRTPSCPSLCLGCVSTLWLLFFNYKEIKTTLNRLFWKVGKSLQTALLYSVVFVQGCNCILHTGPGLHASLHI